MDPEATLTALERAILDKEFDTAVECLSHYIRWRLKGGIEPSNGDSRADALAKRLWNTPYAGTLLAPTIAAALRDIRPHVAAAYAKGTGGTLVIDASARAIALELKRLNPQFDVTRFLDDCGATSH